MPENSLSGKARVICDIFAIDSGRMAGPPRPPEDVYPSTLISKSSVSESIGVSDGQVFDDEIASAPPRNEASASSAMLLVAGVSFTHTGTFATSLTATVTTEQRTLSFPTFDPMSTRSMCGHEKFSSSPSAPTSCTAFVSSCQWCSSLSLPEPAMIDAMRILSGNAFLMFSRRGIHQSIVLSEMSSQFHDECSAVFGRFFVERRGLSVSTRRNLVFGPFTFTTGWRPMVFVTTPPQPASNARMMLASDSVGGADASRNGLSNFNPVNVVDSMAIGSLLRGKGVIMRPPRTMRQTSGWPSGWQMADGRWRSSNSVPPSAVRHLPSAIR